MNDGYCDRIFLEKVLQHLFTIMRSTFPNWDEIFIKVFLKAAILIVVLAMLEPVVRDFIRKVTCSTQIKICFSSAIEALSEASQLPWDVSHAGKPKVSLSFINGLTLPLIMHSKTSIDSPARSI